MFEEKESFWKKKGFYVSACVLLVCVMAVGAVCYRKANFAEDNQNMMANIATEVPDATADSAGNNAITSNDAKQQEKAAQANANLDESIKTTENESQETTAPKAEKKDKATAKKTTKSKEKTESKAKQEKAKATSAQPKLSFDEEKGLLWPVKGDVILKYSMNNAIYFKTLAQYKCNPGIAIASKVGTKVKSAADCMVTGIKKDDELGTVVTTDIGGKYKVLYGQMDNISVNKGDKLKEGDVIGTVAEPTKFYTEEGSNLYFQIYEGKKTVDPLLLLR